ncbi:type II toxin-antitoxin system RelE/ParE family toxin [Terrimonas sp. NA20]|uniref:Type II toxin-antitoxin system RelE/ParE family toxin n=1 Tax=Terrimonas ginsenosidimutans TaxID=2908004 RepID=A0ABS9KNG3_9BACT|nr:type II toxin-antitoxin system RelE/ParE family toxin [Terrimonas ginsenosidimutans]MCG2613868.1 type II toxin-antitoxin system RelE/ParE family toxin [Terrimonas ginsenosidimutans]
MSILWDKRAFESFTRELVRARRRSFHRAGEMEEEIISAITKLAANPQIYPPDNFMRGNKGAFRIFRLQGLNISYHISEESSIFILRVLHWRRTNK